MNVLVTDGENRSALAVTRSLGRSGCNVFVVGGKRSNLSSCSKYCCKGLTAPDPLSDPEAYAEAIVDIVNVEGIDVVFPTTEQSIHCINKVRERISDRAVLACAPPEKMELVSDKYKLFQLAKELHVPIPETLHIPCAEYFFNASPVIDRFPVVVKPALSKREHSGKILGAGVMYACDRSELVRLYESKAALRYPSLIQEVIPGEGTGLFTLFDQDRHLALFSHRRLLEKPPSGGVSVLSESVAMDERMIDSSQRLLFAVGWQGIAMVEFKRDERDGVAKLMEINGRMWGSLQLAVSSGIDFPALCLNYHLGVNPASLLSDYSVGCRLKWVLGILDHILIRMKSRSAIINLPPGTPSNIEIMTELLIPGRYKSFYDVYQRSDIRPFLCELKNYVQHLVAH